MAACTHRVIRICCDGDRESAEGISSIRCERCGAELSRHPSPNGYEYTELDRDEEFEEFCADVHSECSLAHKDPCFYDREGLRESFDLGVSVETMVSDCPHMDDGRWRRDLLEDMGDCFDDGTER